jgi:lipopolysaccharide transport system ATP-binding protein
MSSILIKAEGVSKYYTLGVLGSRTFKEDLVNWWFNRPLPSLLTEGHGPDYVSKNYIWALKDISFEVAQGEVLGIIGRNGAGKSTLLKIISRVTLPTRGSIKGNGRTASLLEVGTGFHPELTGRENVFLNGHILGMKKKEIEEKFDEIVDFSGVEQFIDTPVKRFSSGMYLRLAFAVAAHLNPEILIVDEVLAVGDAEFQRKCIGKMKEISTQKGKTILFVSHNMEAHRNLCDRAIALSKGRIIDSGKPDAVIANYLKSEKVKSLAQNFADLASAPGNDEIRIKKVQLLPSYLPDSLEIDIRTPLVVEFEFWYNGHPQQDLIVALQLFSFSGDCVFDVMSEKCKLEQGMVIGQCAIPGNFLNDGSYYISIAFMKNGATGLFYLESCLSFDVEDYREGGDWYGKWMGQVRPNFPVRLRSIQN